MKILHVIVTAISDCEELKKRIEILEKESEEREGMLLKKN